MVNMTHRQGKLKPREPLARRLRRRLPGWRPARLGLGLALVAGGMLGFLPILGFWMIPLGLSVLAVDSPPLRRLERRLAVRYGRWRQGREG